MSTLITIVLAFCTSVITSLLWDWFRSGNRNSKFENRKF